MCVIANLFFLFTKNDIIVHYNKIPNLGVCCTNFPNLTGPRTPSQNCKKNPCFVIFFNELQHAKCLTLFILMDLPRHVDRLRPELFIS